MNAQALLHSLRWTRRAWRAAQVVLIVLVLVASAWPPSPRASW